MELFDHDFLLFIHDLKVTVQKKKRRRKKEKKVYSRKARQKRKGMGEN